MYQMKRFIEKEQSTLSMLLLSFYQVGLTKLVFIQSVIYIAIAS